eukprot:gnl/TRDRNA2_/TRDRNA2_84742_c0_seq1.p1 gnl/TRDRNA2_/TRDRNA2_84742_c0~~gnl/TRDRNA2_/TRDRNA2_84742_c0_seq1.p1  ORF type:complete len:452 (+),score=65.71 gnl/TRDRNA2_/TRDRNA2_84742_c0_seq1:73-1428(+)
MKRFAVSRLVSPRPLSRWCANAVRATEAHENASALPATVGITFIDPNVPEGPGRRLSVRAPAGSSVVDVAKAHGIDIHAACGQKLQCATCHVILPKAFYDKLNPPGVRESDMLESTITLTDTSRLGCQVRLTPELEGVEFTLPNAALKGGARMSLEQSRPRVEKQWTAVPAAFSSRQLGRGQPGWGDAAPQRVAAAAAVATGAGIGAGPRPAMMNGPAQGPRPAMMNGPTVTPTMAGPYDPLMQYSDASASQQLQARLKQLEVELQEAKDRTAIAEFELRQVRFAREQGLPGMKLGGDAASAADKDKNAASSSAGSGDSPEDDDLAKAKKELERTRVDTENMGRRVAFDDVIGLEKPKQALREAIVWPAMADPALFFWRAGQPARPAALWSTWLWEDDARTCSSCGAWQSGGFLPRAPRRRHVEILWRAAASCTGPGRAGEGGCPCGSLSG